MPPLGAGTGPCSRVRGRERSGQTFPGLLLQRNEYVFTLMAEESPSVLVGLRYAPSKLHFLFWSQERSSGWQTRVTFRNISLADSRWHTLVLAVSGQSFSLTVDCSSPKDV